MQKLKFSKLLIYQNKISSISICNKLDANFNKQKKIMKTFKFVSVLVILSFIGFTSCKKDKSSSSGNAIEKYFTVKDGTFENKDFPAASASGPSINVQGNTSVLAGGTNPVSVTTDHPNSTVLVSVSGRKGYYKISPSSLKNSADVYLLYLLINQSLTQETFTILIAVMDSEGLISEHQTIEVERIEAGTGKLQVSCSWNTLNDVDLHLVEPNSEEIYYGNSTSVLGGDLDVDSNAGCSIDGINNENITYADSVTVEAGQYIVRVDLWSACSVTETTNFIVNAYYNGALIATSSGTNPYTGSFVPADADGGGSGDGREVMRFNISAAKMAESGEVVKTYKFAFPNHKKILSPQKI